MKRIIVYIIICLTLVSATNIVYAEDDVIEYYVTSTGDVFSLTDFDIYIEDFKQVSFTSSQEVIDYIYEVGNYRQKVRDVQYSIFGKTLTEDELKLVIQHPIYAAEAYECSQIALSTAAQLYSGHSSDGEIGNAFQHAYWVMLMYYNTSPTFAIDFATAHENYEGNLLIHKTMDLYNNEAAYNYCVDLNNDNANYTQATIASFVENMMEDGSLIYIIFDYEYIDQIIYYMATGTTRYVWATADLYAYTNSDEPYSIPDPEEIVMPAKPGGGIVKP